MTIQEVARQLAGRLKQSEFASESDMEDIIGNFEDMADDPDTDTEDYDQILSELYVFADRGHRIWLKAG